MKRAVGTFCSNQPSALELIKTKKKKDQRFNLFMQVSLGGTQIQRSFLSSKVIKCFRFLLLFWIVWTQEAESNRLCRRLQLKDIIPVEMQRVTKYPLLLANITKYTGTTSRCTACSLSVYVV